MIEFSNSQEWDIGKTCPECGEGRLFPTGDRHKETDPETGEEQDYIRLECSQKECDYSLDQIVLSELISPSEKTSEPSG